MAKKGALLRVNNPPFYCKKVCGDPDFSIDEWNKALKFCNEAGIEGEEADRILHPELFPCETQCQSCINTVIDTQQKTKKLTPCPAGIKQTDMREFIVCFYQDGEAVFHKADGSNRETVQFKRDVLIRVSEQEMFKWLEIAHHDKVKLSIYEAKMVCDLS